jgi:hypothetical protein
MLYISIKLMGSMFNIKNNTHKCDIILLSIVFHDALKYGNSGKLKHTRIDHDKITADFIKKNKNIFLKIYSEYQFNILEECVRYHSGR